MLSDEKKYPQYLMALVAFSIIIKLLVFCLLLYVGADFTLPDSPSYLAPVQTFLNHGVFWDNKSLWMRTPLYPLIISGVYWLFGKSIFYIIFLQIFLSAILVINAYRITELLSNSKIALFAAALVSIDYLYVSYANLIMTDSLFAVIFSFIFYYAIKFMQDQRRYTALIAAGVLLALATLMRPLSYYVTPVLAVILFFYISKKENVLKAVQYALILILPSLIVVGGWQVRNKAVIGTYQYTNIDAVNLYHYYAADNLSHVQGISVHRAQENLANKAKAQAPTGIARYGYYRSEGLKILLHYPGWSAVQFVSGFVRTLFGNDYILLFYNSSLFRHAKQLENDFFSGHYAKLFHSMLLTDWLKLFLMTGFFIANLVIVSAAIYYVYYSLRNKPPIKSSLVLMLIFLGYFCLVSSNYCSQARFRLPFEIILDCFAVLGCYEYALRRKSLQPHQLQESFTSC